MILSKTKLKSIDLDSEINSRISRSEINSIVLIVPTNRRVRTLKRKIIDVSPGQSSTRINLETLSTFSSAILFQDNLKTPGVLSEAAAAVLLRKSFQSVKLKYFSAYKGEIPFGTLERVGNVISEYKKHGITPELLLKETELLDGAEKLKAMDIAAVYSDYNVRCKSLGVKEIGDVYESVNELSPDEFERRFRIVYKDAGLLVINGFDEFTSPEIQIISTASLINNLELFVTLDYYQYNPLIFSHLDKCYTKFIDRGFKVITDKTEKPVQQFNNVVREKLFNTHDEKQLTSFADKITLLNAPTREKEIGIIAKEIKNILADDKVNPSDICIVFNLIQTYTPVVRDTFNIYKIPFNLTDRYSLDTSSPVVSIINYLEIIENDFYYKNIFRALSSNLINIDIDVSNLLYISVKYKIVSGYENWKSIIYSELKSSEKYYDEFEDVSLEKKSLKRAYDDLEKLHSLLSPFTQQLSPEDFVKNISGFIHKTGISLSLLSGDSESSEKNVKALTTFLDVLNETAYLLQLEYAEDKKFSLRFYLNQLRTAVSSSRYNIKEKHGYGVQITTLNEIRGLSFKYLFIAGMCDGDLPTRFTPEIFYSGSFMQGEANHQTEQRYLFYQALCSWEKRLYLSYPKGENKKELTISSFLTEFNKLFKSVTKNFEDYNSKIYSKKDLLSVLNENRIEKKHFRDAAIKTGIDIAQTKNAISIQNQRRDINSSFEYSGTLSGSMNQSALDKLEEYKERDYSISQLETYASCPFKYFAERVLGIKSLEEPAEEIEPLEMGSLLHSILYEFYFELKQKKIVLKNCSDKIFKSAEELLFNIAEVKVQQISFDSPNTFYEKEKILGINGNKKHSILFKFIEYERANEDLFIPEYFEFQFGKFSVADSKETLTELKVNDVNLRGKIDRIDINPENNSLKIVDYKLSGKKPARTDIENGLSLQLPIYMLAAKKFLEEKTGEEIPVNGAGIYSLKYKDDEFGLNSVIPSYKEKKLSNEELNNLNTSLMEMSASYIKLYKENITKGLFHLSKLKDREEKICGYCNFKTICRVKEQEL